MRKAFEWKRSGICMLEVENSYMACNFRRVFYPYLYTSRELCFVVAL
jgi:hypothetical protein